MAFRTAENESVTVQSSQGLDVEVREALLAAMEPVEPRQIRPCVALAEDDTEMRKMLATTLRKDGFDVVEVANGAQMLDLLDWFEYPWVPHQICRIDLVISDIRMPGLSGLEMLAELHDQKRGIPVILITAFGDEHAHAVANVLGAVAVLDKPFDLRELRALVQETLPSGGRGPFPQDE